MTVNPPTQYATDANLAARQRLWAISERRPPFDLFDWVLDRVGITAGDARRVLDVGCGNGRYEQALRDRGHQGVRVAIDLSRGMLDHVESADRMQSDVQHLPLVASAFDVVLAPHMLYHVPDVAAAAHELRRELRPGGVCVAVTSAGRVRRWSRRSWSRAHRSGAVPVRCVPDDQRRGWVRVPVTQRSLKVRARMADAPTTSP